MDISVLVVEVSKLTLKPGDILTLRTDRHLTLEQANHLRSLLEDIRPDGVKIALLDGSCQLQIIEPPITEA